MDDLPVKALSIRQPWVWAILNAGKRLENRTVRWKYRGPICLHASLFDNAKEFNRAEDQIWVSSGGSDHPNSVGPPPSAQLARGGIVGVADIVDCIDGSDDPWWMGPYALVLANVRPVNFIPVSGSLGLFDWRKNL